jgi:hypothetical protein
MTSLRLRILAQTLPFLLIAPLALAQTPASKAPSRAQATAAINQPANPGAAHYTRQQIDQIVAPIALYPDQLLSQVLMGATYPQQIAEAAQWLRDDGHADLKGDALVQALEPLPWDPSVKALVAFPQIVEMMSEHIEWTEALGVAFATQQAEVMARVQALRQLAMKSGKLKQVKHLQVRQEGPAIVITSAEPDRVYVPVYNPTVVYGQWQDREFPPVYLPPPREFVGETIEPGFEVSRGFAVVAPLWGWSRPDWRADRITVNRTEYTRITRNVEIGPGDTWRHSGPVVLAAPGAVSRTTTVTTTNVPAGTVLPGRAAAVVSLPQRAAAQPNLIHSQSSTTETTRPGQTTTAQPGAAPSGQTTTTTTSPGTTPSGQTPTTTTAQPSKAEPGRTTAQPSTTQPAQSSTTAAQPSKTEPGKTPTTAAHPTTTQPGKAPTAATEPSKGEPGKTPAGSSTQPSQATEKSAPPNKEQAGTSHLGASQTEKNKPAAASETAKPSGQSGKAEVGKTEAAKPEAAKPEAAKPEAAKPEASKSEAHMPAREHKGGETPTRPTEAAKGQGTTSPAANLPKEHTPGSAATKPSEPGTPRAAEHTAPKPATGSSEQPGHAPDQSSAKPSGGSQMPAAAPAPGHEPQRAAPPQGGQGSSAAPPTTPHQPVPNAQRPNAPGARPSGQPEQGDKEKKER